MSYMNSRTVFNPDLHYFYSELEGRLLKSAGDFVELMRAYKQVMHNGLSAPDIFGLQVIHDRNDRLMIEASRSLRDYICSKMLTVEKQNGVEADIKNDIS